MTATKVSEKKAAVVTVADDFGNLRTTLVNPYPDVAAGDLAYLDPARPHDVQIRPMLNSERPPDSRDSYPPGAMWLVWTSRSGFQVRSIVQVPAPYRKNIRSNVSRAIAKTAKFSTAHGHLFALAHAGADPFDKGAK